MPIPRPTSDNYEYPSDAGIMGEDYRLDQLRFKEVTDDELKAFQEPVVEGFQIVKPPATRLRRLREHYVSKMIDFGPGTKKGFTKLCKRVVKVNAAGWINDTNLEFSISHRPKAKLYVAELEETLYDSPEHLANDHPNDGSHRELCWAVTVTALWQLDSIVRMIEKYNDLSIPVPDGMVDGGDGLLTIKGKPAVWVDPDEEGEDDNT